MASYSKRQRSLTPLSGAAINIHRYPDGGFSLASGLHHDVQVSNIRQFNVMRRKRHPNPEPVAPLSILVLVKTILWCPDFFLASVYYNVYHNKLVL